MKNNVCKIIVSMIMALWLGFANAAFLSFTDTESDLDTTIEVGDIVSLSFGIFDLADTDDLGGYDIDLDVAGTSAMLELAVSRAPISFDISNVTDLGNTINLFGLSFLFDLSGQNDSFALGAIVFRAVEVGTTTISVSSAELSDAFGLMVDAASFNATLNVVSSSVPQVSAPSSFALILCLGFALLRGQRFLRQGL